MSSEHLDRIRRSTGRSVADLSLDGLSSTSSTATIVPPVRVGDVLQRSHQPTGSAEAFVIPAAAMVLVGSLAAVLYGPMWHWTVHSWNDHGHFPYTPFLWASTILSVAKLETWGPIALGVLVGLILVMFAVTWGFDRTSLLASGVTAALLVATGLLALPFVAAAVLLIVAAIITAVVFVVFGIACIVFMGFVVWALLNGK